MSEYRSDDEILELIKRWFQDNGTSLLVTVGLAIAAVIGFRSWTESGVAASEAASDQYDQYLEAVDSSDASAIQTRAFLLGELKANYGESGYAALATLLEAKRLVDEKNLEGARVELQWVVTNAPTASLKDLARLRLARVQYASGQTEAAESSLAAMSPKGFVVEREELRGDMAFARADKVAAKSAYEKAVAAAGDDVPQTLQMKLDDLGGGS